MRCRQCNANIKNEQKLLTDFPNGEEKLYRDQLPGGKQQEGKGTLLDLKPRCTMY